MCSIFASFNIFIYNELSKRNSYRGRKLSSGKYLSTIFEYDVNENEIKSRADKELDHKELGLLRIASDDYYYIGHCHAPTTSSKTALLNNHPSRIENSLLWHNGIIKSECISEMQRGLNIDDDWDTKLLHHWILEDYSLGDVDGSFSCLFYDGTKFKLFRNEIAPMFIDNEFNLSSVKFEGARLTTSNIIFEIDLKNKYLHGISTFKTKNNPYYFIDGKKENETHKVK